MSLSSPKLVKPNISGCNKALSEMLCFPHKSGNRNKLRIFIKKIIGIIQQLKSRQHQAVRFFQYAACDIFSYSPSTTFLKSTVRHKTKQKP